MNQNLEGGTFRPMPGKVPAADLPDIDITLPPTKNRTLPEVAMVTSTAEQTAVMPREQCKPVELNSDQLEMIYYGIVERISRNGQSLSSVLSSERAPDYRWAEHFYDTIKMYATSYRSFEMKYKFADDILNSITAELHLAPDTRPAAGAVLVAAIKKSVGNYDTLIQRLAKP